MTRTSNFFNGSSPRVWGTEDVYADVAHRARFIPTGVGNRSSRYQIQMWWPVHPHGCGEQEDGFEYDKIEYGSSPRVWGTAPILSRDISTRRFIPTGVGNSYIRVDQPVVDAVHPHGCGEQGSQGCDLEVLSGSSPRVWGTDLLAASTNCSSRFIPTGVGNR